MNVNRKAAPGVLIATILAQNRKSRQSGSAPLPTFSPPLEVVLPSFLPRDAILARYMLWPSVRPPVCNMFVLYNGDNATPKARDSSFVLSKISAKFDRLHPLRGRQMQVGWRKINDFRQITCYI